jgi:vacuolar-type H+-ATPase subunit H
MSSKKNKDKEIAEMIDTTLEETKSSVNKTTNEAKKEVPKYTKAVTEYQEETIQATQDIAESFLESQKQVISSTQSLWTPYFENMQNMYWSYWTPKKATENYTRAVSNITDSSIAATRLANNYMFASMEVWRITMRHTKDNAIEFSHLYAKYARTIQNQAADNLTDYRDRQR